MNNGEIKVNDQIINNKDYQNNITKFISYLPQNFFILNTSIYENITFKLNKLDTNKIKDLLSLLNMKSFIGLENFQKQLGERFENIRWTKTKNCNCKSIIQRKRYHFVR